MDRCGLDNRRPRIYHSRKDLGGDGVARGSGDVGRERSNRSALMTAVFANIGEGVLLIDPADRISLWNGAFPEMLELPLDLLEEGAAVMPLIRVLADRGDYGPGDPATLAQQIAQGIRDRRAAQGERQMANGKIIEAAWIPLADGHLMFRLRDVTSDRAASRFKDELIATVSHELRTPLTAILGALGLMQGRLSDLSEERIEALIAVACKNGDRLARLVNDLLEIDRLAESGLDFRFEPVDIGEFLAASVEQCRIHAQSLGVTIDLEVPKEPVIAEIDRDRIMQVMGNLLSNAAKFSPPGSRARVRLTPTADSVRISVIDSGRGMSARFKRRLFSRFAQEGAVSERGQGGAGLGLAISKSIIDRHRGQIQVSTREGIGSIFHIDLPRRQVEG